MSKLTKEEIKWVGKVQKALNECPSKRIGFFTIGDNDVTLYDTAKMDEIMSYFDAGKLEYGGAVEKAGALFSRSLVFPNCVDSTSG